MKKIVLSIMLGASFFINSLVIAATKVTVPVAAAVKVEIKSPERSLELLKEGNQRFLNNGSLPYDLSSDRKEELKDGQFPFATIVSCSDSRVVASHIFNQGLGELFEVKLAGNVVDKDALGSIEYAVVVLKTPLIVVLGHESCGAVYSTVDINNKKKTLPKESAINSIVEKISPSVTKVKAEHKHHEVSDRDLKELVTVENARVMKDEILKNSAIRAKVIKNEVKIVVAKYMLDGSIVWE